MTVSEFYEMVYLNERHTLRIKSEQTGKDLAMVSKWLEVDENGYAEREIQCFATDWNARIYILWI